MYDGQEPKALSSEQAPVTERTRVSKPILWTARVLRVLVVLFLLFDAYAHITRPAPVVEAFARLGLALSLGPVIGVLKIVLLILYLVPRTSVFGAVLLTGYLGGAIAINMRAGSSLFEILFPIIPGVIVWAPLYLTDARLRAVFPVRGG